MTTKSELEAYIFTLINNHRTAAGIYSYVRDVDLDNGARAATWAQALAARLGRSPEELDVTVVYYAHAQALPDALDDGDRKDTSAAAKAGGGSGGR